MIAIQKWPCRVFGHRPGRLAYRDASTCTKVQYCDRCGDQIGERVLHERYTREYISPHDCSQISRCARCGQQAQHPMISHTYPSPPEYESPNTCRTRQACERCGNLMIGVAHTYDGGVYMSTTSCIKRGTCTRCGQIGRAHV